MPKEQEGFRPLAGYDNTPEETKKNTKVADPQTSKADRALLDGVLKYNNGENLSDHGREVLQNANKVSTSPTSVSAKHSPKEVSKFFGR